MDKYTLRETNAITLKIPDRYKVDFDKVQNIGDIKNVLQILFTGLPITINDTFEHFDKVKEYLVKID